MANLDAATLKIFSKHLEEALHCPKNSSFLKTWRLDLPRGSVDFNLVWIQGFVTEVASGKMHVLYNDTI